MYCWKIHHQYGPEIGNSPPPSATQRYQHPRCVQTDQYASSTDAAVQAGPSGLAVQDWQLHHHQQEAS